MLCGGLCVLCTALLALGCSLRVLCHPLPMPQCVFFILLIHLFRLPAHNSQRRAATQQGQPPFSTPWSSNAHTSTSSSSCNSRSTTSNTSSNTTSKSSRRTPSHPYAPPYDIFDARCVLVWLRSSCDALMQSCTADLAERFVSKSCDLGTLAIYLNRVCYHSVSFCAVHTQTGD